MDKVSAYIIALNEEYKIREAIESVQWADEVIILDSESTDGTKGIARSMGARVVQVPFKGFGALRNTAIGCCSYDWIFSLDADERCTPEVRDEIRATIAGPGDKNAFCVPRRNYFMGRWIRYSGWYPDYRQPQLFRKGKLRYKADAVHEGYEVDGGIGYLQNAIWQFPFRDLSEVLRKAQRYSSLGAEKMAKKGVKASMTKALIHGIWGFLRMFLLKRGFLDGWAGFVIALSTFEGTFYRYAKLAEQQREWNIPPGPHGTLI